MAATDGHRLSYADSTATLELPKPFLIPGYRESKPSRDSWQSLPEGADMMIAIQGDTLRFVLLHMFAGRLLVTLGLAYVTHSY